MRHAHAITAGQRGARQGSFPDVFMRTDCGRIEGHGRVKPTDGPPVNFNYLCKPLRLNPLPPHCFNYVIGTCARILCAQIVQEGPLKPTIVVTDSHAARSAHLWALLAAEGFRVRVHANFAPEKWVRSECDIVVVGFENFEKCGLGAGRDGVDAPAQVLVTTGLEDTQRHADCLDAGADDLLASGTTPDEILRRIHAAAVRLIPLNAQAQPAGHPVSIDHDTGDVRRNGNAIVCTPYELRLLALLARRAGRPTTYRMIRQAVWGHPEGGSMKVINGYVRSLRAKIERNPDQPRWLRSEPGVGFRWLADA